MSITATDIRRQGFVTRMAVVSDLAPPVYYHWYLDGVYAGRTDRPWFEVLLDVGEQARLDVIDTTDGDFDALGNAPREYAARRLLRWIRSVDEVDHYRVEQRVDGGDWIAIAAVPDKRGRWEYSTLTPRLADLAVHEWRVIGVDRAGNDGVARELGSETVVRRPDAPDMAIAYDEGSQTVAFDLAG